jgi:hypothetical protein
MSEPQRPEPEIIPPGAADTAKWQDQRRHSRDDARIWAWTSDQRGTRLRYGRPGPLGLFVIFATLAALGAVGFFVFLGALAIAIPVIAALIFVSLVAGVLRRL